MGNFKNIIKETFSTAILILLVLDSASFANSNLNISESVNRKIHDNTFILIPINSYAPIISKSQAEEFVKTNCHLMHLPPSEVLNCNALKTCVEGHCVREYASHGTGFLLNNGSTLMTAWHVVYPTHASALLFIRNYALSLQDQEARDKLYENLKPNFILLNHNHEIIYDTRLNPTDYNNFGDPLSTTHIFYGTSYQNQPYGYFENIPEDYLEIRLSKNLGEGLKFGLKASADDEFIVSGFGYDGRNFGFDMTSGQKQSLYELKTQTHNYRDYVLKPFVIPIEDFLALDPITQLINLGYSKESAISQIEQHGLELIQHSIFTVLKTQSRHMRDLEIEKHAHVLFTDNPSLPGTSGGPVTNSNGEVLGILTNGILSSPNPGEFISHGSGIHLFEPLKH